MELFSMELFSMELFSMELFSVEPRPQIGIRFPDHDAARRAQQELDAGASGAAAPQE